MARFRESAENRDGKDFRQENVNPRTRVFAIAPDGKVYGPRFAVWSRLCGENQHSRYVTVLREVREGTSRQARKLRTVDGAPSDSRIVVVQCQMSESHKRKNGRDIIRRAK